MSGWVVRPICARSVARLTLTSVTPGTLERIFSTRLTQDAQVMPPMARSTVSGVGWVTAASMTVSWGRGMGWVKGGA